MDDGIERKPTRPYISSNPGFYREAGPVDWLRTQEGVWLRSTFPFNSCWTLDVSRMGPRWPCRRSCRGWRCWNATTGTVRSDCRRVGRPRRRMTTRWRTCPPRSAVAASLLVDRLTVIDRDGGVLYDGADPDMFAGQWERGFHRPLSAVETADARMRLARIGSLRSVPGVGTALSDPVVASIRRSLDDLA